MGRNSTFWFTIFTLLAILSCCWCAHSSRSSSSESPPLTTLNPHKMLVKTRLEQLKQMEESALKGWYDMVNRFLLLIKPDHETIDVVLEYVQDPDHVLMDFSSYLKIFTMNSAFLSMAIVGLVYVVVMLLVGLFFFCCRQCGRCGAKDSQRQRHNDNCWRTVHKFCLVFMIALLVVPVTCMCIINEHMKQSFPSVKSNASGVFNILGDFANETDADVERVTSETMFDSQQIKTFDDFKKYFVDEVQRDISDSINHEKLEEIKHVVIWVLLVEDMRSDISNASALSKAVQEIKSMIANIREETARIQNCTDSKKKICHLVLGPLPLEEINVQKEYGQVQREFQELFKINFEELTSVIDKIQNNSMLRKKIEEESGSLKKFAEDIKPDEKRVLEDLKKEIAVYTDGLRKFSSDGKKTVDMGLSESEEYERYRWWSMFGVAVVLVIPVALLCLGLTCGCFGYEKERHPTKRSALSNCGGICFILAVYYFFLIASALMLLTIGLFLLGGGTQTFVCVPLYESNFEMLDEIKSKFDAYTSGTVFQNITPSQVLLECRDNRPILHALGFFNESDSATYERLFKERVKQYPEDEEIEDKLKAALSNITSGIRQELDRFTTLDLSDMKDLPQKLEELLNRSKQKISEFIDEVKAALNESNEEFNLHIIDDAAADLWERIADFEKKLLHLSSTLQGIYKSAEEYKDKMRGMRQNLDDVEGKLPKIIKEHLFQAAAEAFNVREMLSEIGRCEPIWIAFDTARTAVCDFVVNPVNGFWFGLGWILVFIIPTILFAVKLSRHYLRMKYEDDPYLHDSREAIPLEEMSRSKPFSYTNNGAVSWMPQFTQHQNYVVHPTSSGHARQFHYK